jgi:hypothetical protein
MWEKVLFMVDLCIEMLLVYLLQLIKFDIVIMITVF